MHLNSSRFSGRTGDTQPRGGTPSSLYEGLRFNNQNKKPHGLTRGFEQQGAVGLGIWFRRPTAISASLVWRPRYARRAELSIPLI